MEVKRITMTKQAHIRFEILGLLMHWEIRRYATQKECSPD
jgi:hypothetical protein